MATTINKQKTVNQLFTALSKQVKNKPLEERPVLEQFVYAILRENATRDAADQAFKSMQDRFFDWNEVRVSSTLEIVEALDGALSDPETRAQRIIDFLQEIFETTFSFDLDPLREVLQKKGMKQAAKQLSRYQAVNDYAVAWVLQQSLGTHAVPLDASALRVLKRIGLLDGEEDLEAVQAAIENQVPKAKASLFMDLISTLADAYCSEEDPACSDCPMRANCPTGMDAKATMAAPSKKPR